MEQIAIFQAATPAQREAAAMHFEILEAAKAAAGSLLELGRRLKKMRDSGMYRELGFESFGEYTEAAVGIRQRQAYTYINVVETLPAKLIEENAAAGVTKLALLAKLGPEDREEIVGDALANITVKELQRLVEERDMLSRQMSLFPPIDAPGEPMEAVAEAEIEEAKRLAAEETRKELEEAFARERERMAEEAALAAAEARRAAREQAYQEAEKQAAAKVKQAKEAADAQAKKDTEKAVKAAREAAAAEAAKAQAEKDRAELEKVKKAEAEARQRAETLAGKLQLNADEDGVRFILLFEQMRDQVDAMRALAGRMRRGGKAEQADKYTTALKNALDALRQSLQEDAL